MKTGIRAGTSVEWRIKNGELIPVMFRYVESTPEIIALFLNLPGTRDVSTCLGYSTSRRFVAVPALMPPRGMKEMFPSAVPGRQATKEQCGPIFSCLIEMYGIPVYWVTTVSQLYSLDRRVKLEAAGIVPAPVPLTDGLALPVPFSKKVK